jgi:hypothetical protein
VTIFRPAFALCGVILCLSLISCGGPGARQILRGTVQTPDITITAEDNSFTYKSGQTFENPNKNKLFVSRASAVIDRMDAGLKAGGKRVKVTRGDKSYFGILLLAAAHEDGRGPGSRSYSIVIPDSVFLSAVDSKVAVCYEVYPIGERKPGVEIACGWVLWISDGDVLPKG